MAQDYQSAIDRILRLLKAQKADEAVTASIELLEKYPRSNDALLLLGKARQQQGRFGDMLRMVEAAHARDPQNLGLKLQYAGACHFCGHHDRALEQFAQLEEAAAGNTAVLQSVAEAYGHAGRYEDAHRCYLRIAGTGETEPRFLYNLASSYIAVGDLAAAEATYSRVIERQPQYHEAWYSRSTLRKVLPDDNHIDALRVAVQKLDPDDSGYSWLCYALAKEYEDVGDDEQSFDWLEKGAASRHRELRYDVRADVAAMRRIAALFGQEYAEKAGAPPARRDAIFVLGLPRSGTTLVDRILGSHSEVQSLGELTDFALALTRLAGTTEARQLLDAYARIDPERIGREYLRSVATYGVSTPHFIDKMPSNFQYVGVIAQALPGATILHVRRHPVDSCLSMFRTMFRNGYPFSYDLESLAEYYIAYDRLMQHWRTHWPDAVHDVAYEDLVIEQERVSRDLLDRCGLSWEPGCLEFDRNPSPVMTASAAQVRRPVYRDALHRWRRFENRLAPLIERLEKAGIAI